MTNCKIFIISVFVALTLSLSAKDYKASLFGVKSDGVTVNTGSIQYAINYISKNGGGTLQFYVGRYLTGTFEMKPNVTIELKEGAVLVASHSIYDYLDISGTKALILADSIDNIGITGKGVIDGNGMAVLKSIDEQKQKGYIDEKEAGRKPALVHFNACKNVKTEGIIWSDACGVAQVYTGCTDVEIKGLTVQCPNNGIVLSGCNGCKISDSYFETSGREVSKTGANKGVSIVNCTNSKGKKIK